MIILITGVHGFVGSNLVKALSKEHDIYGLDIISPQKEGVKFTFGWEHLDNPSSVSTGTSTSSATVSTIAGIPEVDAIIHLAGKAHDTKSFGKLRNQQTEAYFKVNTELTKKVYDYFLAHESIKKFIFFSSVKAAADRVEGAFVDENVEPKPVGPYGESKIKAEEYIRSLTPSSMDKDVYILRPCMIHGPGNKGNLNLLYGVVKKGIPWPLGAFENKRTFTSIDNLCYIIEGLLTKDVESGVYNINDDEAVSTNELIEIICEAMGKKAHIWRIPRCFMEAFAKLGGLLHLPLNPERLQKLTENYVSSNAKIKRALGIEKLPVRAKDGLYKTIKSFEG